MKSRIFNSTIFAISAYFVVHFTYLISQFLTLWVLEMKGLSLNFFYTVYTSPENSWWTRLKVFSICGSGILSVFTLLFVISILYIKLSKSQFKLNIFYSWIIIICIAFISAEFMAAPIFGSASFMNSLLLWLHFDSGGGGMFFLAILFSLLIPVTGYLMNKPFLKMVTTTEVLKTKFSRMILFIQHTFIPFAILVALLIFLLNFFPTYELKYILAREVTRISMLAAILIFGSYFSLNKRFIAIQKTNTMSRVNIPWSILLILFWAALFFLSYITLE